MSRKVVTEKLRIDNDVTIYNGDCSKLLKQIPNESVDLIITSPPYCIGKAYENPKDDIDTFKKQHSKIFPDIYRVLKDGGSICWQVGYHISNAHVLPLDYFVYEIFTRKSLSLQPHLILRNRIVWTFGHGLNSTQRFSGRHEMLLWFTKGNGYSFDLDSVRIPQRYPGKRAYKGPNKGNYSGNPLGKNPSDVWDIPNVKARHIEKTDHPCQFPVAIPQRLIKALTPLGGVVLDPYMGSGTSGVAAIIEKRKFIGAEIQKDYYDIAIDRIIEAIQSKAKFREDVPVEEPNLNSSVAKIPDEFIILTNENVCQSCRDGRRRAG
jgi:adenine-specific DNA-methyltransferase